ncbi:unnamed protein product [Sphagnum troendelagicum]|uniref:C2 domain-containing protein n=1 Tax=Sphagnum troendelagicum TaxID=128251 RepID=A0ABP0TM06_9BRYO
MAHPYHGGVQGIQGHQLEINVVGCKNLNEKEWFSEQYPYVVIEYNSNRFRTRTDTDVGRNPTFDGKFIVTLIEDLREVSVSVWNSNTFTPDDLIGSTRILLEKALSSGYDDTAWPLKSQSGMYAGELRSILHYSPVKERPGGYAGTYPPPEAGAYPGKSYPPPPATGYATAPPYPEISARPFKKAVGSERPYAPPYAGAHPPPATECATAPSPPEIYPPLCAGYPPQQTYPPPSGNPPGHFPSEGSCYSVYPPAPYASNGYPASASDPPKMDIPCAYPASPHYDAGPSYPPAAAGYPPLASCYPPAHIPPTKENVPVSQFVGGATEFGNPDGFYFHSQARNI